MKEKVKKQIPWSEEDDQVLAQCVAKTDTLTDAFETAADITGRTPGAAMARYYAYIKPKKAEAVSKDKPTKQAKEEASDFAYTVVNRLSKLLTEEQKISLIESWV